MGKVLQGQESSLPSTWEVLGPASVYSDFSYRLLGTGFILIAQLMVLGVHMVTSWKALASPQFPELLLRPQGHDCCRISVSPPGPLSCPSSTLHSLSPLQTECVCVCVCVCVCLSVCLSVCLCGTGWGGEEFSHRIQIATGLLSSSLA